MSNKHQLKHYIVYNEINLLFSESDCETFNVGDEKIGAVDVTVAVITFEFATLELDTRDSAAVEVDVEVDVEGDSRNSEFEPQTNFNSHTINTLSSSEHK